MIHNATVLKNFSASALIQAPPKVVYAILADYHQGHAQILPKPPFLSMVVEKGGVGDGTVLQIQMQMLSQVQTFRAVITEPEPGRLLMERTNTGYITTFTVDPRADSRHSYVTIATRIERTGISGMLELLLMRLLLRPVYIKELRQLAAVVNGDKNLLQSADI